MSEDNIYYKNHNMQELDETLGDIHGVIVDTENKILRNVQSAVLECDEQICQITDIAAEFDW